MALKKEAFVTDDIVHDRFMDIAYRPLSRYREVDFIKKLKLSFYDDVDDDLKQLYIDYYGEVNETFKEKYDRASGEEKEEILNEAIKNACLERDRFIENNIRLVFSIAYKYHSSDRLEDLNQVGFLGLMRALEKFDIRQKTKFSTYATWWIRQAIKRHIADNTNTIRVPVHMFESITSLNKAERRLEQKFGRVPSAEELALELNISMQKLNNILEARSRSTITSLETPINEDEDNVLADIIPNAELLPEEVLEETITREMIDEVILKANLDDKSKRILYLRFGFEDGEVHTLEEIGKVFGITRERVRQIEKKALNMLKSKNNMRYLLGEEGVFLENKKESLFDIKLKDKSFKKIRNLLLETDLSDLDEELQVILDILYGLSLVIASAEEIAEWKGVQEDEVIQKENEALQYIYKIKC